MKNALGIEKHDHVVSGRDCKRRACSKNPQHGFTLIELILSLVILGIVGAIGAVGFTDAVRGYIYGVDNANIAGKAQAALDRLNLELTHIDFWDDATAIAKSGVTASTVTSITYDVDFGDNKDEVPGQVISYSSGNDEITLNGDVLVDDVTNFSFVYYDDPAAATGATVYTPGQTMCIGVTMELTGANEQPVTFSTRVVPMFDLPYAAP